MKLTLLFVSLASISVLGMPQQGPLSDEQAARYLAAAQEAEKSQDYATAGRQYEALLKQAPNLAIVRQSLAITYHLQNRYSEAISEFQRALRLDPKMWGSYLFLGMDYYKTNQFSSAIPPLQESIALNAKMAEPEARFWLALTYLALDKPEDAVRELRRDLPLRRGDPDVLYPLVEAYDRAAAYDYERLGNIEPQAAAVSLLQAERFLDENRRDLAGLQYRNAVQLRPDFAGWIPALAENLVGKRKFPGLSISATDARANLELADLFAAAGETPESVRLLENLAIEKTSDAHGARIVEEAKDRLRGQQHTPVVKVKDPEDILKGLKLIRQGQFREAKEPLLRAAQVTSNSFYQLLLIRSYVESGDCEPIEGRLDKLLAAEPRNVDALLLAGRSYKQQAETTLQQMIQLDPDSYGVHELLGRQHEEKTEYDLAVKEYMAALAKRPEAAGIRYAIGNVYRKMNRYDEAEKWLREELVRNPYHGLAHYRLGSIYTEQGKPDAAIPHLLQALQSHPHMIDLQLDLGRAYIAAGKYQKAIAALKSVSQAASDNDRVHYLLSVAYSKEGQREDARTEMAAYQRLTRDRLHRTQADVESISNSLDR